MLCSIVVTLQNCLLSSELTIPCRRSHYSLRFCRYSCYCYCLVRHGHPPLLQTTCWVYRQYYLMSFLGVNCFLNSPHSWLSFLVLLLRQKQMYCLYSVILFGLKWGMFFLFGCRCCFFIIWTGNVRMVFGRSSDDFQKSSENAGNVRKSLKSS